MMKYDKSLLEVWEWKDKVYNDIKDLSSEEYIEKIKGNVEKTLSEKNIKLKSFKQKKERKIA